MHFSKETEAEGFRHVLGLSGGKDSAALAVYIKDKYPALSKKMEYFFSDTGSELKEVYEFLDKLESFLDKEIKRLSSGKTFEHWLKVHNDYLPSPKQRWCTRVMKIKPFEEFIKEVHNKDIDIGFLHRPSNYTLIIYDGEHCLFSESEHEQDVG